MASELREKRLWHIQMGVNLSDRAMDTFTDELLRIATEQYGDDGADLSAHVADRSCDIIHAHVEAAE